jgi:hypothetical protein
MSSNKKYNTRSSRMRNIELPASNMTVSVVSVVSLSNRKERCKLLVNNICKDELLETYSRFNIDCFKRLEDRCMGKPDPIVK